VEGNEGARPSDPRRISNQGAPPADPENRRRGGLPWGRIIAAIIGLLLLALLIPLACQALGGGDPGGKAGNTEGEQDASGETTGEQAQGSSEDTAASGRTTSDTAPAAGGDTTAPGGGTAGGEVAEGPSAGASAASGAALATGGEQSGDGTTVTVPQAEISGVDGWLAIHADDNGRPGEILGHAPLREGENADVVVRLDQPTSSGRVYAMVHADDPNDDAYTFPDGDPPVEVDGQTVVEPIQYAVTGDQAGGDSLPASGGPQIVPALLAGSFLLVMAAGAVLVGRLLGERKA
jgi:hypothetical protein